MPLPSTDSISMNQVNVELGRVGTTQISLNESTVRSLAQRASGQIGLSDLRGRSRIIIASGGNFTTNFNWDGKTFRVHKFTTNGTFTVTNTSNVPGFIGVEYLIVGGGGGGGAATMPFIQGTAFQGGGGGGGGVLTNYIKGGNTISPLNVGVGSYGVVVGSRGEAGFGTGGRPGTGGKGGDSSFFGLVAVGGGGGGFGQRDSSSLRNGGDGGSGGGGGAAAGFSPAYGSGGLGFTGQLQGNNGRAAGYLGTGNVFFFGGGGGGSRFGASNYFGGGPLEFPTDLNEQLTPVGYGRGGNGGNINGDYEGCQISSFETGKGGDGGSSFNNGTRCGGYGINGVVLIRYRIA